MTELENIVKALEASWGPDTAFNKNDWSINNKARGQCVVSSLIIQDYLGGELLKYSVNGDNLHETHYFNQLSDGTMIDATGKQYTNPVSLRLETTSLKGFKSVREKRLSDNDTRARYELLKSRVESHLLIQ